MGGPPGLSGDLAWWADGRSDSSTLLTLVRPAGLRPSSRRLDRAPLDGRLKALGVHRVQAVAQLGVMAREQVAVAVQREADGGVTGSDADLLGVGANGNPQRHRRVAKVMRAQRRQAGRAHGRKPHLDAEVRSPQHAALLGGEYVRVSWADRPHVGGQLLHHDARQPDAAAPGPGLGWAGVELAMDLNDDLGHIDGPAQQVDTAAVAGGSGPGRSGFGSRGST